MPVLGRPINILLTLLLLVALLPACKDFAPEPVPEGATNPERNFEVFWHDVNLNYPFFELDGVDWQAQYNRYRPLINSGTSDDSLFAYMSRMMTPLMDGHASLVRRDPVLNRDIVWANPRRREDLASFAPYITLNTYLGVRNPQGYENRRIFIGEPRNYPGVVYVYLPSFEYTGLGASIDSAIRAKGIANVKGVILDIRYNGGGLVAESERVAGLFVRQTTPYLLERYKNGPRPQDLTPAETRSFDAYRSLGFTEKPVVVLVNWASASSSERLRLALRGLPNTYCIGDTTYGATSPIVNRTLPNGWKYVLVGSVTSDLNGVVYERRGVPPDTLVRNTNQTLRAGQDLVMEAALARMR